MAKLVDGSYICILEHFSIFNTKNISKIKEKLIQMRAIPLSPPSLRAESLYQCRRAHSGHRSLEGRRPLTSQGDASHVNDHKNIKTAFMFVQPFAHSYISQPFRDRHYALGGTYTWPHFCQKYYVYHFSEKWLKRWRASLVEHIKKGKKLVPSQDSFTYAVK